MHKVFSALLVDKFSDFAKLIYQLTTEDVHVRAVFDSGVKQWCSVFPCFVQRCRVARQNKSPLIQL